MALDVAAGAQSRVEPAGKRVGWPLVVLPAALLVAAGIAFFLFSTSPDVAKEAAETTTLGAPSLVSTTSPGEPIETTKELRIAEPEIAEPEIAEAMESAQPSAVATQSKPPIPPRGPAKAPPKKTNQSEPAADTKEPVEKRPTDAWDPNNFGGRE